MSQDLLSGCYRFDANVKVIGRFASIKRLFIKDDGLPTRDVAVAGRDVVAEGRSVSSSMANPENWSIWAAHGGMISSAGVAVSEQSSLKITAVFQCVDIISRTLASVPWKILEERDGGKYPDKKHAAYNLLKTRPHPHYSSGTFRKNFISNLLLYGAGCAKINRDKNGRVLSYELRDPVQVMPVVSKTSGELWYYDQDKSEVIHNHDMIYVLDQSSGDGIHRRSRIMLHRDTIGQAVAQNNFISSFYKNGTLTAGFVESDEKLKPEQRTSIIKSVVDAISFKNGSGGVGLLDWGFKFKSIGMPLNNAQFVENRKFTIEEIARIFGMPLHLVGHLDKMSFNNVAELDIGFVKNTVSPLSILIDQEFTYKTFIYEKNNNRQTKLELKGLLHGDIKSRTEYLDKMIQHGIYSINEVRAVNDENPLSSEIGDIRRVPTNTITLKELQNFSESLSNKKDVNN